MERNQVRFSNQIDKDIAATIRQRVNDYFTGKDISTHANWQMRIKTAVMLALYLTPYVLLISGLSSHLLFIAGMWTLMGLGMAGVGFSIMHDANHNAYSANTGINKFLSLSMYAIGGNPVNWRIQHNMLHHGFTNIHGMDEDISAGKLLRMSPEQKRYRFHRFQHYYAWFLYSIMTIYWFLGKDIPQLIRYRKMGLLSQQKSSFKKMMTSLVLNKFAYGFFALLLPVIMVDIPWWQTLLFFIGMHLIAGLLLGLVFQPAHVIADNEFPIPDEKGKIENNWMVHQVLTTANYAPKSRIFSWFIGGLNFQIEHHLFANICHVHYHKISPIVQQAVKEFGLPYHVNRTFFSAIADHARMLRQLGKYEKALS